MAAALEAAGVATASALRRAELEEETDGMLESLINRYACNFAHHSIIGSLRLCIRVTYCVIYGVTFSHFREFLVLQSNDNSFCSKILSADLSIQVDEEKKKIFVLRRRLQKYAEKMAAMELATVVQGLKRQDTPSPPKNQRGSSKG